MFPRSFATSVLAALALLAAPARPAAAQEARLWELSPGLSEDPAAQYVVVWVPAGAEEATLEVLVEDAFGTPLPAFAAIEPGGDAGYRVAATAEAARAYAFAPDETAAQANLGEGGGRVCLRQDGGVVDCVAYGNALPVPGYGMAAPTVSRDQALTRIGVTGVNSQDWEVVFDPDPTFWTEGTPGEDGGFGDGGDGGLEDGGPDGGLEDGGPGDAGADDGGPSDGGVEDGGPSDGGVEDGGGTPGLADASYPPGGPIGGRVPDDDGVGCVCGSAGGAAPVAAALLLLGVQALRRRRLGR